MTVNPLVSITDMKTFMRYENATAPDADDVAIEAMIDAAVRVIETRIGSVVPKRYVQKYDGGACSIYLRDVPVIEVNEVLEGYGAFQYNLSYQDSAYAPIVDPTGGGTSGTLGGSPFAYSLDYPQVGCITKRTIANTPIPFMSGLANVQVTYTAGMQSPPGNIILACKSLVAYWWTHTQFRTVATSGAQQVYDAATGSGWSRDSSGQGGGDYWIGVPMNILMMIETEQQKLPVIG